jgi:hypothetical protein
MTKEEIAAKADWEGGIADLILDYELDPIHIPEDAPDDVKTAWCRLYGDGRKSIAIIERWLKS